MKPKNPKVKQIDSAKLFYQELEKLDEYHITISSGEILLKFNSFENVEVLYIDVAMKVHIIKYFIF